MSASWNLTVPGVMLLVQIEILAAVARLAAGDIEPGYHELPDTDRRLIAQTWLAHFRQGIPR